MIFYASTEEEVKFKSWGWNQPDNVEAGQRSVVLITFENNWDDIAIANNDFKANFVCKNT